MSKKRAKKSKVEVYDTSSDEPKKRAFDGFIKHPWYTLLGAAIVGAIVGALFWRRKR